MTDDYSHLPPVMARVCRALVNLLHPHGGVCGTPEKIDEAHAALEALAAARQYLDWTPIEQIPEEWKDGRPVELGNKHGAWVGYYCPVFISGYRPNNPWSSLMLNHRHMPKGYSLIPTHARLLTPPPKEPSHD